MLSPSNLPVHLPDLELPIDLDDLTGRLRDATSTATGQAVKLTRKAQKRADKARKQATKRAAKVQAQIPSLPARRRGLPRLTWPLIAVLAAVGIFAVVRSRSSASTEATQTQPSGSYARS